MRIIDTSSMRVVHCGDRWPLDTDPCSRDSIQLLERNEGIVSWLQPEGGRVEVRDSFWFISHFDFIITPNGGRLGRLQSGLSIASGRLARLEGSIGYCPIVEEDH